MKKDTQCVHSGTRVDRETRGLNTPIYTSSLSPILQHPQSENPYRKVMRVGKC
jgi:O-acetylhomoserine/O-acetylserine sulfhydrylase-like pyridoxal-dependent enzyme